MAIDLNAAVGTVTADTVTAGQTGPAWSNPSNANDGNSVSKASLATSLGPTLRYLIADLGDDYECTAFKWYLGSTPTMVDLPQWSDDGVAWTNISYTETGGRQSSPDGATLTFDSALTHRYWRLRAVASGFHSRLDVNTWQIIGEAPAGPDVVAAFSGTPTSIAAAQSVQFTDASTGEPDTWAWDFGDLGTSTSQNPSHTYTTAGTYTVTLTATRSSDASTDDETKTFYVTVTDRPMPGVWVDWGNDGAFNSTTSSGSGAGRLARMLPQGSGSASLDDEITADVHSFTWSYGGSADHVSAQNPGQATILVQNADGKYNPDNSGSVLNGLLKPGRRVWAGLNADGTITDSGLTVHGIFAGYIRQIVPLVEGGATALAEIICEDPLGAYSRRPAKAVASTGYSYHTLRQGILEDIGETRLSLASEVDTLPLAAVDTENALSALEEINRATGSRHWSNPSDSKETWQAYTVVDRHHKLESAADAAINADDVQSLSGYRLTEETIVNTQSVEVAQARFPQGIDTVWTSADPAIPVTTKRTIWADFGDFVKDAVLDFTSTGGAVTSTLTNFGTTAKIELWSASSSVVQNLTIEGRMVVRDAAEAVRAEDSSSQATYGKRSGGSISSTYASTPGLAQGLADYVVWKFKQPLTRPAIGQINEFPAMLARDLYDVITLTVDRLHVVARRYEIIGISGYLRPGIEVGITWELQETPNQSALDLFTLDTDTLNGVAVLAR